MGLRAAALRGLPRGGVAREGARRPSTSFGRGASRRQRERAMVAMGDSLPSRMGGGDQPAGLVASE